MGRLQTPFALGAFAANLAVRYSNGLLAGNVPLLFSVGTNLRT